MKHRRLRQHGVKLLSFALAFAVPVASEATLHTGSCFRCEIDSGFNFGFYCSTVDNDADGDGIECRDWTTSSGSSSCRIVPEPCHHTVVTGGGGGGGGSSACTTPIGGGCPAECFVCETRI